MKTALVILLYNILLPPALLIALPGFVIKMRRRGGYGGRFFQRFAIYGKELTGMLKSGSRPFWIHAVSVGEVGIAKKLIDEIRRREPDRKLVLTTTTSTGFAIANKLADADPNLTTVYNPLDLPPITWRARRIIRPERIILVEAEVWPNLVRGAQKRGIPTTLVNARLSPRSERRYKKFKWAVRHIFGLLDSVCVQEQEDKERWSGLGVDPKKILHTGSIKFDQADVEEPSDQVSGFRRFLASLGVDEARPTILAASTHPDEEAHIGRAVLKLRGDFPDLFYIAVPRHFERAGDGLSDLVEAGFSPVLKSEVADKGEEAKSGQNKPDCLVVDTTGELRAWQYLAGVVIIGKSFLHIGGQNPAEAVAAGRPVVFGPHMENFAALVTMLLGKNGAIQVDGEDPVSLAEAITPLFQDASKAEKVAKSGQSVLDSHRGATSRTADLILGQKT